MGKNKKIIIRKLEKKRWEKKNRKKNRKVGKKWGLKKKGKKKHPKVNKNGGKIKNVRGIKCKKKTVVQA